MASFPKVLIGIPSRDEWMAEFGMSLTMLVAFATAQGFNVAVKNLRGSILPNMRNDLAKATVEAKADYLLMLDSDMVFPHDTLSRLSAQSHYPIVAAGAVTRKLPANPTAFFSTEKRLDVRKEHRKLVKVWRVGAAVMLIKREVFEKIPAPWFPWVWKEPEQMGQGEDWGFCEKLDAAGIPIMVDVELTREIGHVGTYIYTYKDVKDAL